MKLKLKEDPKEWRKTALLSAIGLALWSAVLRWRHVLSQSRWIAALLLLTFVMLCAVIWPRAFRGYYRVSSRIGFWLSQTIGKLLLVIFFLFVLTPLGLVLRLCGKDLLRLKRPPESATYWNKTKETSPLDWMF
jgi:hypothetical protein